MRALITRKLAWDDITLASRLGPNSKYLGLQALMAMSIMAPSAVAPNSQLSHDWDNPTHLLGSYLTPLLGTHPCVNSWKEKAGGRGGGALGRSALTNSWYRWPGSKGAQHSARAAKARGPRSA